MFPKGSTEFTEKVCSPSLRSGVINCPVVPFPHETSTPSSAHSNVPGSVALHVILVLGLLVCGRTLFVICTDGPWVSEAKHFE